jgi:hypothetical protein
MFCHLKPWQLWQVVFYSYECKGIQTKNAFDEV